MLTANLLFTIIAGLIMLAIGGSKVVIYLFVERELHITYISITVVAIGLLNYAYNQLAIITGS